MVYVCLKVNVCMCSGDSVAPLSEAAQRDLTLASITVKYTQSNSVGYACAGQMVRGRHPPLHSYPPSHTYIHTYIHELVQVGVGAGQQSRVDCVKLAARKAAVYFLRQVRSPYYIHRSTVNVVWFRAVDRQHPKVQGLKFRPTVKRQDRVNARVRYIEGDITPAEK